MWNVNLANVEISSREKIALVILLLIIALGVLLIGVIYNAIKVSLKSAGRKIDDLVRPYLKQKLIHNEKEFVKVSSSKNQVVLFKELSFGIIFIASSVILLVIYTLVKNIKWTYIFDVLYDLTIKLDFTTTKLFGLTVISDWPTIRADSFIYHTDVDSIIAYIFTVLFLVGAVITVIDILRYGARSVRIRELRKLIYHKPLDNEIV